MCVCVSYVFMYILVVSHSVSSLSKYVSIFSVQSLPAPLNPLPHKCLAHSHVAATSCVVLCCGRVFAFHQTTASGRVPTRMRTPKK